MTAGFLDGDVGESGVTEADAEDGGEAVEVEAAREACGFGEAQVIGRMDLGEVVPYEVVDRELEDEDGNSRFPEAVTEKDAGDCVSGGEEAGEQNCAGEAS